VEAILSIPVNFGMTSFSGASGSIAGSVLPIRRAEELIATLPGVLSVRIVPGESGSIEEIHVLTTDLVAPKNTVRNIESALMAQLGLRVNHRTISIATTLDAPRAVDVPVAAPDVASTAAPSPAFAPAPVIAPVSAPFVAAERLSDRAGSSASAPHVDVAVPTVAAPMPRSDLSASPRRVLVFEDVEVRRSRTRGLLSRVTLSRDGQEFVGESEGHESERSRIELAARSTLLAIMASSKGTPGSERSLALDGAKLIGAFDREFVFVSVSARMGRESVVLTGSCAVRESAETSAVLAVLDATNRWVHLNQ